MIPPFPKMHQVILVKLSLLMELSKSLPQGLFRTSTVCGSEAAIALEADTLFTGFMTQEQPARQTANDSGIPGLTKSIVWG